MRELAGYALDRELGRGATAQVFLARRQKDLTPVALKVFHPGLWDQGDLKRRALAEVRTILALKHPNIVSILEPLLENDPPAVALEYVNGTSLEEFQPRLPYILPELSVTILIEVLSALEHAHAQKVIHRDLKPANILIGNDGRVLVTDFGLAKMTDISRFTLSGAILGSPDYMAPEQAQGDKATEQSDLFAATSVLYFLVTGTRPFTRHSPLATLAAVSQVAFESPQRRNPKLSGRLSEIIHKGLSREPSERFQSASEYKTVLRDYLIEVGLAEEDFSFPQWIRSPTDTAIGGLKSVAEALERKAEHALSASQWEEVLLTLSHLSMVAPESAAILRIMDSLERGKKRARRKKVLYPSLSLGAVIAIGVLTPILNPKGPSQSEQQSTTRMSDGPEARIPAVIDTPVESLERVKQTKPIVPKPHHGSRQTGLVRFEVPTGVRIFWDDEEIDPRKSLQAEQLGTHRIRLVKSGASPIENSVNVQANEPTIIRVR